MQGHGPCDPPFETGRGHTSCFQTVARQQDVLAAHSSRGPIRVRKRTLETKGKTLFYILYSINLFLIEIVVFRFQEADKWRS